MVAAKEKVSASGQVKHSASAVLAQLRQEVNSHAFEREEVIDGILSAILARKHVVQIGLPGCAKSFVVDLITSAFTGLNYFSVLLHEASPQDEILGGLSLKMWKDQDVFQRNITGRLPWAHIANLEEVFNAPDSLLHVMLRIANERLYDNPDPIQCPLISIIASSNKLPEKGESDAFFDRMLLRYPVDYLQNADNKKKLMLNRIRPCIKTRISLQDVQAMHAEVDAVDFPDLIADAMLNLETKLAQEASIFISDRRRGDMVDLLKAYAYLNGDTAVCEEHFSILAYCLWKDIRQMPSINSIITAVGNPMIAKATEIFDGAKQLIKSIGNCPTDDDDATSWQIKASGAGKQLKGMIAELSHLSNSNPQASAASLKKVATITSGIETLKDGLFNQIKAQLQIQE